MNLSKVGTELTSDEFFNWVERQDPILQLEIVFTWSEIVGRNFTPGRAAYIVMETVELARAENSAKH